MKFIVISVVSASVLVTACGGDTNGDAGGTPTARTPAVTSAAQTPASSATEPGATPTRISGGEVEVQGIVGAVDEDARTIEINRLQGADVDVIKVDPRASIRSARGATLRLGDLRPSDRIIARGTLADGVLVATKIEVGQVVPGSVPGG